MEKKMMTLPEFLDKYGSDTTSNFDLLHWAKQLGIKNFHYAMRDEMKSLNKIKKHPIFIIANYETSKENGSHHIALYKDNEDNYYFDSYGIQPFQEAIDFLGPHYLYSTFQIQKPNQRCCGQYSLYFLYCLHNGKNYYDIVLDMVKFSYL